MNIKQFEFFDKLLALSVLLLTGAIIVNKLYFPKSSLAVFNLILSMVPFIYVIIKSKNMKLYKGNSNLILYLIIIVRIITSVFSYINLNGQMILEQICYDISLIIFIIAFVSIDLSKSANYKFKYFPKTIVIMALLYCIYNISVNISNLFLFTDIKYRYLISFSSFFTNKNLFGEFLMLAIFSLEFAKNNNKSKVFYFLLKTFFVINMFLTLSRNAILCFCIFELLLMIIRKQYKKAFVLITIVLIVYGLNIYNVRNLFVNYILRADSLTSGRDSIWKMCYEYFLHRPILGYGELYISNIINGLTGVTSMHSWYFKILLNGGLINLVCYLFLIGSIVIQTFRKLKRNKSHFDIIFSCIISLLVYGVFEEINLFEFGLISIIMTMYFCFIPKIYGSGGENVE